MRAPSMVLLALALSVPAQATWGVAGSFEPDTTHDLAWIPAEPDTRPTGMQVYFNAVVVASAGINRNPGSNPNANKAEVGANPNLATAEGRFLPPSADFIAFLGVWKDCNRDGYIGLGDQGVSAYRAELVPPTPACPEDSFHRRNGWVREFRWIGPHTTSTVDLRDPDLLADLDARVWGDPGLPGSPQGPGCRATPPFAPGTTGSTGGLLAHVDCRNQRGLAEAINTADPDGQRGIGFEDPQYPERSGSRLNQPVPLHPFHAPDNPEGRRTGSLQEDSGDPAFEVWDCDAGTWTADVRDPMTPEGKESDLYLYNVISGHHVWPVGPHGHILRLPAVRDPGDLTLHPHGSYYETYMRFREGLGYGSEAEATCRGGSGLTGSTNNENTARNTAKDALERATPTGVTPARRFNEYVFTFFEGSTAAWNADPHAPGDGGLLHGRGASSSSGPTWYTKVKQPPEQAWPHLLERSSLRADGAQHFTFYARVGDVIRSLVDPLPGEAVYGAAWCGSRSTGIVDGFDCDPTHWWDPAYGAPERPRAYTYERESPRAITTNLGSLPGERYHLRDVDCYDGHAAVGVYASLTPLSTRGTCRAPVAT